MSTVRARVWRFRVDQGQTVVAKEVAQGDLPVGLARIVQINAMACDLRKVLDYRTKQLEVRLLLSYLGVSKNGDLLRLDHRAFMASSRHIRGFVSECAGLGVLTATSEALFAWRDAQDPLHSFDALPSQLLRHYDTKGVRPDLLFHLPSGPVAGEARGRYRSPKVFLPVKPLAEQKERLRELANWSVSHSDHAYFMSWVWIGQSGVAADVFLPEDGRWDDDLITDWANQDERQEWRFPLPRNSSKQPAPVGELPRGEKPDQPHRVVDRLMLRAAIAEEVLSPEDQAEEILDRLYASAPAVRGSKLGGIPVRGGWVRANALGPAQYEVLLGVLAERPPRPLDVRTRLMRAEGQFDACIDGRLLTVVRPVSAPRPQWRELEWVLFGDR
ncbi:hypothetical protein M1P56_23940 [Streptomyces sp. HU2014]|uniref:hypothetical protein n=1 Tax=Streptomyces sp. HU2014 TaxID=2939414 RepID=UPI00200BC33D|nr:hypothetical protein [Streptomyces sp. HU2014]UQI47177.1 hypothetical protein M1P56_23940 [Streptomyces sp. HU2014]